MAIKVEYTIICDEVRREDNGKMIIIGVYFGAIVVAQIPLVLPSLTFFQLLKGDRPGTWNARMKLQHLESGRNIVEAMGAINFQQPGPAVNAIRLPNVQLTAPGTYNFVMEIEGQSEPVIVPFDVILNIPQPMTIPGMLPNIGR